MTMTLQEINSALNIMIDDIAELDNTISAEITSTDDVLAKHEAQGNLSDKAREVISTVIDRPDDFVEFCLNNSSSYIKHKSYNHKLQYEPGKSLEKRLINIDLIKEFFRKKWHANPYKVARVMDEITEYTTYF